MTTITVLTQGEAFVRIVRKSVCWPVVLAAVVLMGCNGAPHKPPPIAADLNLEASLEYSKWQARLAERFTSGTSPDKVIEALRSEGFKVDPVARTAAFQWGKGVCNYLVTAEWTLAADGSLATIDGVYMPFCP
jgi:hypothetical protein